LTWRDQTFTYGELAKRWTTWRSKVSDLGIEAGSVVAVQGDFTPSTVTLLLALIEADALVVPVTPTLPRRRDELLALAEVEWSLSIDGEDQLSVKGLQVRATHPHYRELRRRGHPGLVLFSSGSSGKVKAAVHDFEPLLDKFMEPGKTLRTMSFLLYDHIGGMNTLLYTLTHGGCLVTTTSRDPDRVLGAIARHRVELLPTTPTFLNLALVSGACERYELSCLQTVTYGTEPMPELTLKRLAEALPHVELRQTYGLSEVGILPSRSEHSTSLLVKLGGSGFSVRIKNGILQIKAKSAMLGYLNAPSPWTEDGWLDTGDAVEQHGDYLRILGRRSELINVGGEKVYPSEVEGAIQSMPEVADAVVVGKPNPLTGMMICATVRLVEGASAEGFSRRLKEHLSTRLERFKIPVKIDVGVAELHGDRFKKMRSDAPLQEEV
jgi:acyl-CoA synthetase (AMP-forming)/AMP-acid ligase II